MPRIPETDRIRPRREPDESHGLRSPSRELAPRLLASLRRTASASAVALWVRTDRTATMRLHLADPPGQWPAEQTLEVRGVFTEALEHGVLRYIEAPETDIAFGQPFELLGRSGSRAAALLPLHRSAGPCPAVVVLYFDRCPQPPGSHLFEWSRWASLLDAFLPDAASLPSPAFGAGAPITPGQSARRGEDRVSDQLQAVTGGLADRLLQQVTTVDASLRQARQHLVEADEAARFVRYAAEGLDRIEQVLERLLVITERRPLQIESIDLADCAAEVVRRLQPDRPQMVRLTASLPAGLTPVLGDRRLVVAALMEITRNALSAAQEGTEVGVVLEGQQGGVRITVRDQGPGMDAGTLAHACRPFFSTRRPDRHLGLGLSLAESIVRRHGGSLNLSSRPGEGTTVRLWFPAIAAGAPPALPE
jgi:two-component sensor histidine kinase